MKKLHVALLALAVSAAIQPVAKADSWYFTASGGGVTASGTLTGTSVGGGVFDITAITGTYSDTNDGISGNITGLVASAYNAANPSTLNVGTDPFEAGYHGVWTYDNLLYPAGTAPAEDGEPAGGLMDTYGLLFDVTGGYIANIYGTGRGNPYWADESTATSYFLDDYTAGDNGSPVSFAITATPEPSSLLLLGTGLALLAGMAFRKVKTSALALNF
jgi:hypothetical protein